MWKEIGEWAICIIIAIVLALLVRTFIGSPTVVQQPSMYPTFVSGDRLILNKIAIKTGQELKRGDIVTFEAPTTNITSATAIDLDNPIAAYDYTPSNIFESFKYYVLEIDKTSYIKRVIATEGQHIKIENGKVYINGTEIDEDYLQPGVITESADGLYTDLTVPKGCVFVMGDNRGHSTDSRRFGCIPLEKIESKVLMRFWPFEKFGTVE